MRRAASVDERSRASAARAGRGDRRRRAAAAELEDFGIVQPKRRDGRDVYDETDLEIVRAAAELSKFGVGGRNLRVFRTSADREAALLEQLLGAPLRSRSQARRKEAVENLESLAAVCGHLKHLLLVRDLRRLSPPRSSALPRVSRSRLIRPRRTGLGPGRGPIQPAALVAEGDPGRGRARPGGGDAPLDNGARDRARGGGCAPTTAAPARPRRALRLGAADRRHAVRAGPAQRGLEIDLSAGRRRDRGHPDERGDAARPLEARRDDDARRGPAATSTRRWRRSSGCWSG